MATRTIIGQDDPANDVEAIRRELRNEHVDRIMLKGTFNFGVGQDRETLQITRPVTIEGLTTATIRGGGWDEAHATHGVFWVENDSADAPVAIRNLHFTEFRGQAIRATACRGLEVSGCRFTEPVPAPSGLKTTEEGKVVHAVSGILAFTKKCAGRLRVMNNTCDFRSGSGIPDDEQFLVSFQSAFNSVRIIKNTIVTRDDGVEVLFNAPVSPSACEILIQENNITAHRQVTGVSPYYAAIVSCLNGSGEDGLGATTEIVGNKVDAVGVMAFALSGEHFIVRDNEVRQAPLPGRDPDIAAVLVGVDAAPFVGVPNMGPSLNDSDIFHNKISGRAQYGIAAYNSPTTPEENRSRGNVIEDNDFAAFNPVVAKISVGADNFVIGNS